MRGLRKNLLHIKNNQYTLQCNATLWYNQVVVNDVVKTKTHKLKT
jgi:hypothetical protein